MRLLGFVFAISVSTAAHAQFPPLAAAGENPQAKASGYLNVIASDASGNAIKGLTATDFSLSLGGQALSVINFSADASGGRSLVLVVDDMGLSPAGMGRVRQALEEFLAGELKAEDRAAIVRTSGGSSSLLQLTSDRQALATELERIEVHPLADPAGTQAAAFLTGTLQGLRMVISALAGTPGKKAVVLFSERLTITSAGTGAAQELIAARCAELALMADAAFYAVDLRPRNSAAASIVEIETGMAAIAAGTGGLILDGSANLSAALQRVLEDCAGSYRLGFKSSDGYRDSLTGTDIYRKLAVRTEKPGVVLRAPATVYGVQKSRDNSIAVGLTPLFIYTPAAGTYMNVLMHVVGKSVTSVRNLKGTYAVLLDADWTVFNANGEAGTEARHPLSAMLTEAGFESARRQGIAYPLRIAVRGGGLRRVEVRVTDPAGGRAGGSSEVFMVPAAASSELMMSGIILAPDAENVPPDQVIREGAAVRHYPSGSTFRYAYDLYNLARDTENRSSIEMRMSLLRHGQEITVIPPRNISFDGKEAQGRNMVSGAVHVTSLAPGHYSITITSIDKQAAKPREVTQYTDFWIIAEGTAK